MFELDPRLKADTHFILQWPLSQVLLMDDRRYPWLILVPTRLNVSEPFDLTYEEQALLSRETTGAIHGSFLCQRASMFRSLLISPMKSKHSYRAK